jgi:Ala-tRNA(Pro) deacylase
MGMAVTLKNYLRVEDADFKVIPHQPRYSSSEIAQISHICGDDLAKGVLVRADEGLMLVVVPSTHVVDLSEISHKLGQRLGLATETDVEQTFEDCDVGAIPACGSAYGVKVFLDDALRDHGDIYFEAGDHEHLVMMSGKEFERLIHEENHGAFSHHR